MRLRRLCGPRFSSPCRKTVTPSCGAGFQVSLEQPPQVVGKRVLLGELGADHRQQQRLALIDADQKMGNDDVLDVGSVELGEKLLAQARDGRRDIARGQRLAGRGRRLRSGRANAQPNCGAARDGRCAANQE